MLRDLNNIDLNEHKNKLIVSSFAAIGTYYLGLNIYGAMRGFVKYCMLPRKNLYARYGGGWALVTGASDGLGKQYCMELAKSGFNIILMARNAEKLDAVAKEISDAFGVETKVIVFDFSELASQESAEALKVLLENQLANIDLSVLVNNVGCAKFATLDKHTIWDSMRQVNININS